MVDGHVSDDAETKFCDLFVFVLQNLHRAVFRLENLGELLDCVFAKQRLDTYIALSQVDESLEKLDQVLGIFLLQTTGTRVLDE